MELCQLYKLSKLEMWLRQPQRAFEEALFLDPFRLDYRTQIAIVALVDNISRVWAQDGALVLALLNFSAAFDTTNPGILLNQFRELEAGAQFMLTPLLPLRLIPSQCD